MVTGGIKTASILIRGRGSKNLYRCAPRGTMRGSRVHNREMEEGGTLLSECNV